MIVYLFDKTIINVTEEQGSKIISMIDSGVDWLEINGDRIRVSAIAKLTTNKQQKLKQPLLVAPTTELTDEQRKNNVERIRSMKANFLNRLS